MGSIFELFTLFIATSYAIASGELPKIPKCCNLGEIIIGGKCQPSHHPFKVEFEDTPLQEFEIVLGKPCELGRYRIEPINGTKGFYFFSNGSMKENLDDSHEILPDEYCLETFLEPDGTQKVLPLLCFPQLDITEEAHFKIYSLGSMLSLGFLLMTMGIYLLTEGLRTIYGKVLFRYWFWLSISFGSLSFLQSEGHNLNDYFCKALGFFTMFVFLVSFFWLNIYCFHTWTTVKESYGAKNKKNDKLTMFQYNLYGLVTPLFILAITLIMDIIPFNYISDALRPKVGESNCFIQDGISTLLYFIAPISTLLGANLIFFFLTVWHLFKDKQPIMDITPVPINRLQTKHKCLEIFLQILVLFFGMGLNWIIEIMTFVVENMGHGSLIFTIMDAFNVFYGVIIFLVFVVFDHRVRDLVLEKLFFVKHHRISDDSLVQEFKTTEAAMV